MKDSNQEKNFSFFDKQQIYEYNINDLKTINKPDMFFIIHENIRSLPKNIGNHVIFIKLLSGKISCIGISTTRLSYESPIDTFNIHSYSFHCKSRSSKRGGGVDIHVSKTYKFKERTDLSISYDGIFQYILVEIETANFVKTFIGVIYRPPEYSNLDLLMNIYK